MKRVLRLSIVLSFVLLLGGLAIFGVLVKISLEDLPSIDALKNYQPPQSTIVYDRNGDVVGRFFDERRTVVSLDKLPEHVSLAFVAAEDSDFFLHRGIDYFALLRAIVLEIKYRCVGGRRVGGSTITQQAARTMLLSSSQTYGRKIKEMILAHRIEQALSKKEILHLYLNQIYFGKGAYGIEEAALTYFQKPAKKLLLSEAAALASVPKSPNRINPFADAERLKQRQHYVLDQMFKHKFIDKKAQEDAKNTPLFGDVVDGGDKQFAPYFLQAVKTELIAKASEEVIHRGGLKVFSTLDNSTQKAAEEAVKLGLRVIDKRYGYRGPIFRPSKDENDKLKEMLEDFKKRAFVEGNKNKIWDLSTVTKNGAETSIKSSVEKIRVTKLAVNKIIGARVVAVDEKTQVATVDLGSKKAQLTLSNSSWARPYSVEGHKKLPLKKLQDIIKTNDIVLVKIIDDSKNIVVSLDQEPLLNGGLVAIDVKTGGVTALVGGYDFDRSPFNRITQAGRQIGSGIKPLIYAYAIDRELVMGGEPITVASVITDAPKAFFDPGTEEYWRPRNHNNKYLGDITLWECLRLSINTCTITLLEKIGIDNFLSFARDVELNTKATPYPRNLTIALGSAENYPISVANAMRVLANNGLYSPYHMIDGFKEAKGERINFSLPSEKSVLRPEAVFIISQILREVVNKSHLPDVQSQMAGKTGTTNNARSVWFFGYSPELLALVYVGYDDNRSVGSDEWGATTARPIWERFMNAIPAHREPHRFTTPEHIEWRLIDRDSGRVRETIDGEAPENTIMEAFIAGTAPPMVQEDNLIRSRPASSEEAAFAP